MLDEVKLGPTRRLSGEEGFFLFPHCFSGFEVERFKTYNLYSFDVMSVGDYEVRWRDSEQMWIVIGKQATKASKKYENKKAAVRAAKRLANKNGVSVEVFTRDGRHQQSQRLDMTDRATKNPYR